MYVLRRDFLKYCIGSAAALGLEFPTLGTLGRKVLAAGGAPPAPSYPISTVVLTTLDRTVNPFDSPQGSFPPQRPYVPTIPPCDISEYAIAGYGEWGKDEEGFPDGQCVPFVRPDLRTGEIEPAVIDPSTVTLLSFFAISGIHITDKESQARAIYYGYQFPNPRIINPKKKLQPARNSSCYSMFGYPKADGTS